MSETATEEQNKSNAGTIFDSTVKDSLPQHLQGNLFARLEASAHVRYGSKLNTTMVAGLETESRNMADSLKDGDRTPAKRTAFQQQWHDALTKYDSEGLATTSSEPQK